MLLVEGDDATTTKRTVPVLNLRVGVRERPDEKERTCDGEQIDVLTKRVRQRTNYCTMGSAERFSGRKDKEYYAIRSVLCDRIAEGKYYWLHEVPGTNSTGTFSKEEKKNKL